MTVAQAYQNQLDRSRLYQRSATHFAAGRDPVFWVWDADAWSRVWDVRYPRPWTDASAQGILADMRWMAHYLLTGERLPLA